MIPEEASLSLEGVWIDAKGGCPELDIGNYCCNFGINYGLCTSGSGHSAILNRPLPDRPRAQWPWAHYDEEDGAGVTLGPYESIISGYLVYHRPAVAELQAHREAVIACGQYWDDAHIEVTVDALIDGADVPTLMHLIAPGSVYARAADARSRDQWLALRDEDPSYNIPFIRLLEDGGPGDAERLLKQHLIYDAGEPISIVSKAGRILADGPASTPLWPIAEAVRNRGRGLSTAFLHAATTLAANEPLAALNLAANAIAMAREDGEWPDGAIELIRECSQAAHPDYQKWLAELPE